MVRVGNPHAPGATVLVFLALLVSTPASGAGPDPLPEAYWWREVAPRSAAVDPLRAVEGAAGVACEVEWAPIYDGPHASRVRQERVSIRSVSSRAGWLLGAEVAEASGEGGNGEEQWFARVSQPRFTAGTLVVGRSGARAACALALSQVDRRTGLAASARARFSEGITVGWRWSRSPASGRLVARWEDGDVTGNVDASGSWTDQRSSCDLSVALPLRLSARLGLDALDRSPSASGPGDRAERPLVWSGGRASLGGVAPGGRWTAEAGWGRGYETIRVVRGGAAYARASGPVESRDATVEWRSGSAPLCLHAWSGTWRESARGSVAMWPFDSFLGLVGAQRVAQGAVSLAHRGLRADVGADRGWILDGGVALWRLEPSAEYTSWRASFFGLGREDRTSGESRIRGVTALGLRAAVHVRLGGIRLNLEGVQWIPVHVGRTQAGRGGEPTAGAGGPSSGSPSSDASAGGEVLRVSLVSEG